MEDEKNGRESWVIPNRMNIDWEELGPAEIEPDSPMREIRRKNGEFEAELNRSITAAIKFAIWTVTLCAAVMVVRVVGGGVEEAALIALAGIILAAAWFASTPSKRK